MEQGLFCVLSETPLSAGVLNPGLKSVQTGHQMATKWPYEPFRARQGPFWVHFGAVLERNNAYKCVLYCSNGDLFGQFLRYIGCF